MGSGDPFVDDPLVGSVDCASCGRSGTVTGGARVGTGAGAQSDTAAPFSALKNSRQLGVTDDGSDVYACRISSTSQAFTPSVLSVISFAFHSPPAPGVITGSFHRPRRRSYRPQAQQW